MRRNSLPLIAIGLLIGACSAASCANAGPDLDDGGGGGGGGGGSAGGVFGAGNGGDDSGGFGPVGTATGTPSACSAPARSCDSCQDFPAAPIIDSKPDDGSPATPADAASHFTNTGLGSNGPCVVEPSDGTLIPQNWLRPRFRFAPTDANQTLFELRLHTPRQQNDLLVYTTSKTWKMPAMLWDALRASTYDEDITLTVRAVDPTNSGATPSGSQTTFRIAPSGASGAMIYWTAVGDINGLSWLEGFNVGDEGVETVLDISNVKFDLSRDQGGNLQSWQGNVPGGVTRTTAGEVQCIGCHTAVPDGKSVAFLDFYPWGGVSAAVDPMNIGNVPAWLTPGGAEAFSQPWLGIMSFSTQAWANGDHSVITSYQIQSGSLPWQNGMSFSGPLPARLAWINLSSAATASDGPNANGNTLSTELGTDVGTSYGFLARNGDSHGAATPTWSHDGQHIVYVSTDAAKDGRLAAGDADLYSIPYNNRAGGDATPVPGASDPNFCEYYPSYSPDDKLVAFNRTATNKVMSASNGMYYNAASEVYVTGANGAQRLKANDPPLCMNAPSPGITNSWPKWAPEVQNCGGKIYYWVIFSSSRLGLPFANSASNFKNGSAPNEPTSQLYITAVVDDGSGNLTTYPALYVWNQSTTYSGKLQVTGNQSNHTPTWEVVQIPQVPPPSVQ